MDSCEVARPDCDVESDHTRLGLEHHWHWGSSPTPHRSGSLHLEGLHLFGMNYSVCMVYSNLILIGKVSGNLGSLNDDPFSTSMRSLLRSRSEANLTYHYVVYSL
jgi:hypothetical protein